MPSLPDLPGVYLWQVDGEVVYVGDTHTAQEATWVKRLFDHFDLQHAGPATRSEERWPADELPDQRPC